MRRILKSRADLINNQQADWALGEAFAIGSLLMEQVSDLRLLVEELGLWLIWQLCIQRAEMAYCFKF